MLQSSIFSRKLKVWPLRGRYIMSYSPLTLFFSLNSSCCSLHIFLLQKTSPSDTPTILGCLHIQWGLVSHPSSDSPLAPCLSVNAERLYFLEDRWSWVLVVLSWLDTVVVPTCSMSFLPTGHGCGAKCDCMSSRIVDELLAKNGFSQNHWVFLQDIFYDVTSDPREHLNRFGAEIRNFIFLTYFSPGQFRSRETLSSKINTWSLSCLCVFSSTCLEGIEHCFVCWETTLSQFINYFCNNVAMILLSYNTICLTRIVQYQ